MLHPRLNPKFGDYWRKPLSLDVWQKSEERTVKLDVLAQVVKYHLERDGQRPLTMKDDGQTLMPNESHDADLQEYPECDRIVIYSAFPSSNQAILDVSRFHALNTNVTHALASLPTDIRSLWHHGR